MVEIFGILNVTRDSFSDGGRWLEPGAALAHAQAMVAAGADVIDVGAESTHPDAEVVPAAEELRRLQPVLRGLRELGVPFSVDTRKPEVMVAALQLGASCINDVAGMRDPASIAAVAAHPACRVVVMFSRQADGKAVRQRGVGDVVDEVRTFLAGRAAALQAAGVARERILLDPGMGFFLDERPERSFEMLARLGELRELGHALFVSVTRKSFLGAVTGRPPAERGAATLAAEVLAMQAGVAAVRTHDVAALADARAVLRAVRRAADTNGP